MLATYKFLHSKDIIIHTAPTFVIQTVNSDILYSWSPDVL